MKKGIDITHSHFWQRIQSGLSNIGSEPADDEETALQKQILIITSVLISIAALIWSSLYLWFGETSAGYIPLFYAFLSICSLLILKISKLFRVYRFSQIFLILLLPFLLMIALGGFINGSVVIVWSILAPIGAMLSGQLRQAVFWFLAFLSLVILSGLLHPYIRTENNLPDQVITLFFIINIGTVSFITFLVLNYFVKQKNRVIKLIHKNRELEVSQLQKEVMLRQSEKLATLGRLSAGIAHELNNPATAGLRGSKQLQHHMLQFEDNLLPLSKLNFSDQQLEVFKHFLEKLHIQFENPSQLDALARSDREQEIESWLENYQIEATPDVISTLVGLNLTTTDLANLTNTFSSEHFPVVISVLSSLFQSNNLLEEIGQGTDRISEIVKALKSYSYQDKAPLQLLDIHQGLNDTLIMLRSQLKTGITVQRDYTKDLPQIYAYSNELNQVWTNIIDNAITAMNGRGKLVIKTFKEDEWVVVQISDTGQGIPKDIQNKIFDPFFTTKPPGEGTGLGLNISYSIIVQNHHGKMNVYSRPGETCFEVKLPIQNSTGYETERHNQIKQTKAVHNESVQQQ